MKIFALLFVVLASCSAVQVPSSYKLFINQLLKEIEASKGETKLITANINKYVDKVLEVARLEIVKDGLDPVHVKDIEEGFSVKLGLVTFHGEFTLTEGWLQGLSTIMRSGDAVLNYEAEFLNIRLPLTFDIVDINYDYLAKIMDLGPTGGLQGKIKNLEVMVDITLDIKSLEVILQNFEITDAGRITVHFSGNPLVDWLTNILTDLATRLLHGTAADVVENRVKKILEKAIARINHILKPAEYFGL